MRSERVENKFDSHTSIENHSRVDVNNLIQKVKEEEKKTRRTNVYVSAAAVSALAVFGIILTL
tara:strand:+ start:6654 stop:6842 length:189 start_codon:yes stop_codon:yes gene_type:complete